MRVFSQKEVGPPKIIVPAPRTGAPACYEPITYESVRRAHPAALLTYKQHYADDNIARASDGIRLPVTPKAFNRLAQGRDRRERTLG